MQFFTYRWRGHVHARTLLLRDMFVFGTALNVLAAFMTLMALASERTGLAVFTHFLLLPYNLFLVACFWRAPERSAAGFVAAGLWFALMTIM